MKLSPIPAIAVGICLLVSGKSDGATSLFDVSGYVWPFPAGNETHGNGMIGYAFKLKQSVTVTQIGFYDAGGDGLSRSFQVGLWKDLTGGTFSVGSPTSQLLGSSSSGIMIPGGTAAALNGIWRMFDLASPLVLDPGSYQIGTLDTASTTDPIRYISQNFAGEVLPNSNATPGAFFYSATTSTDPGFHATDSTHFYLASGFELGPMLFIVPEPSGFLLTMAGSAGMLLRRRRYTA